MKQVEVIITSAGQALVGDYSVGLSVDGEKGSSKTVEIRVSVKTSAAWGWSGSLLLYWLSPAWAGCSLAGEEIR